MKERFLKSALNVREKHKNKVLSAYIYLLKKNYFNQNFPVNICRSFFRLRWTNILLYNKNKFVPGIHLLSLLNKIYLLTEPKFFERNLCNYIQSNTVIISFSYCSVQSWLKFKIDFAIVYFLNISLYISIITWLQNVFMRFSNLFVKCSIFYNWTTRIAPFNCKMCCVICYRVHLV